MTVLVPQVLVALAARVCRPLGKSDGYCEDDAQDGLVRIRRCCSKSHSAATVFTCRSTRRMRRLTRRNTATPSRHDAMAMVCCGDSVEDSADVINHPVIDYLRITNRDGNLGPASIRAASVSTRCDQFSSSFMIFEVQRFPSQISNAMTAKTHCPRNSVKKAVTDSVPETQNSTQKAAGAKLSSRTAYLPDAVSESSLRRILCHS